MHVHGRGWGGGRLEGKGGLGERQREGRGWGGGEERHREKDPQ